ncbi:MAG: RluA family pseudouridine synthase [Lachnospiraceae bacterium]|nr:RluA family pseudouridine synthase [Lachnospiraceae bacterium]
MNLNIIYIDNDILVVEKPAGLAVQTGNLIGKDLVSELKNYLSKTNGISDPYLGIIHRLDQPVRGLLVFALNDGAAADLSRKVSGGGFNKCYTALVEGIVDTKGKWQVLTDYLIKDKSISRITGKDDKNAKRAELKYRTLMTDRERGVTRLEIELLTGRFHQIRAQLSNMGHPIVNDQKYGAAKAGTSIGTVGIALCAYRLSFEHPLTKEKMEYTLTVDF